MVSNKFSNSPNAPACNYDLPDKNYIKKDRNCLINFLCIRGTQAFKDNCGCGCETNNTQSLPQQPNPEPEKNSCPQSSRGAQICMELYAPVCGWFNSKIECLKYPCAQTFSNSCFACGNNNVDYWTNGECPK